MRIYGLEHYFKRGIFYKHRHHAKFLQEYVAFPRAILRDILDALSFQKDEWESLFTMVHRAGPMKSDEDLRAEDAAARAKVQGAWGRGRRQRRRRRS